MSKKPMIVATALRNTLQHLQQDPRRYKLFGIYWWPMKAFLKAAGYGPDQLYMLKDYRDATTADLVPAMGQEETMRRVQGIWVQCPISARGRHGRGS